MSGLWSPTDDELDLHARGDAPELAGDRADQLRTKLLAAQRDVRQLSRRSATPWIAGSALAVAAAAILILWLGRGGEPNTVAHSPKQVIESIGSARFESVNEWPDFVMRLDDGRISITVAQLEPAERFRVKTADAEVEVRGTQFVVQADNGRLVSVVVERGWVELRRTGEPAIAVRAGGRWDRVQTATAESTTLEPTTSAVTQPDGSNATASRPSGINQATKPGTTKAVKLDTPRPPKANVDATTKPKSTSTGPETTPPGLTKPEVVKPVVKIDATKPEVTKPEALPAPTGPGEVEFRAGWAAMRAGNASEAAKLFVISCAAASGAIAEDACFWAGAAAKRAGRPDTRSLLEQFLRRFPSSSRAGEAAALLGWTLYDGGDLAGAETQFRRAVTDRVPQVSESARRGLTAIERRRAKP